ncbi:MAG: hypothetical protein M1833_007036 [Piccolia ochrophora]|nr:MAG: hypothetical protein M1833_007036 [Piccolia ochrophora]
MRNALFYVATDRGSGQVLGTAMWLPPRPLHANESWDSYVQSWWLWLKQVGMNLWYGRGGLNVRRYYIWKESQAEAQREIWTDERGYYFCNIITVLPAAQGRRIGAQLFRVVTDVADEQGVRCYLESSRAEPNIKIYERMGFRLEKEMECDDAGAVCKRSKVVRDFKK